MWRSTKSISNLANAQKGLLKAVQANHRRASHGRYASSLPFLVPEGDRIRRVAFDLCLGASDLAVVRCVTIVH